VDRIHAARKIGYSHGVKKLHLLAVSPLLILVVALATALGPSGQAQTPAQGQGRGAPPPPAQPQPGHPSGKLILGGDVVLFDPPNGPDNCTMMNRFKKGQRVGFRMTASDGGTGEVESTAVLVAHVTYAGRTVDAPMRFRGAAGPDAPAPRGYLRSPFNLWTGSWTVPDDAPTGRISYTVTATDRFGRTATFAPFSAEASQLVIVQ
jgi:hypothetical protein